MKTIFHFTHSLAGCPSPALPGVAFLMLLLTLSFVTPRAARCALPAEACGPPSGIGAHTRIFDKFGILPLSFEPNRGQAEHPVRFIARGIGCTLFFTSNEAILALTPSRKDDAGAIAANEDDHGVAHIRLLSSNPAPAVRGSDRLSGTCSYFMGGDPSAWLTDIPTYRQIEYADIYPGIDLVYYGNRRDLEYDFIVSPGADYTAIRLAIDGADKSAIDSSGDIVLTLGSNDFRIRKPLVYQEGAMGREGIPGSFIALGHSEFGFSIGAYDKHRPLIIDPVIWYSFWIGDGTDDERSAHIAIDTDNNIYIAGSTRSTTFPIVNPIQSVLGTGGNAWDAFVMKLNASGTAIVYSTYLGSYQDDDASAIVVDRSGCAYVAGASASGPDSTQTPWNECFPLKHAIVGGYSLFPPGNLNVFVAKLSAAGNELVYSTLIGGSGNDGGRSPSRTPNVALDLDRNGSAFVAASTESHEDLPLFNPFLPSGNGFLAKLNPDGSSFMYSTYIGGSEGQIELVNDLAVDPQGNAYVTGCGNKTGVYYLDAFVQKVHSNGTGSDYLSFYGGSNGDIARGIAIDTLGNAYTAGYTFSNDFPTVDPLQTTLHGTTDAFVTKLDPSGKIAYSTLLGGGALDVAFDIAVDRMGNAYVTGSTASSDFPTVDPYQGVMNGGANDAFVTCLAPSGNRLVYSTFLGGSNTDVGLGITLDAADAACVVGWSNSDNFPVTSSKAYTTGFFVTKLVPGQTKKKVQVWQEVRLASSGSFKTAPDANIVTMDGVRAKVTRVTADTISVLVPPELVKNRQIVSSIPDTMERDIRVIVRTVNGPGDTVQVLEAAYIFVPPRLLIHDEVTRPSPPVLQGVLQVKGWAGTTAYIFLGYRTDGMAAVRLTNTSTTFPPPIALLAKVISPPPVTLFDAGDWPSVGNLLNVGNQNAAIQFPIDKDGWYIIVVMGGPLPNPPVYPEVPDSPGPFPAQFQILLSGNVGLPRKLINGAPEFPRGIRLDTYFNHPAPRTETLGNNGLVGGEWAEAGLFKFANPVSVSQYPIAVLIPPSLAGFPIGTPPVRAQPPLVMGLLPNGAIDITTPMAATRGAVNPLPGTVIDLAQVPVPASVLGPGPPIGVARIIGAPDGSAVTLPFTASDGTRVASLILDMGSGNEIVDGSGADFTVIALSGSYDAAVGNTPFDLTFKNVGSGTGRHDFDIAGTGLSSARYVRLSVSADSARFDALEALHLFTDQIHPTAGPLNDVGWATITMRSRKSPPSSIDPMLELIAPDGSALGKNDSGFGDDLDPSRSDAALINLPLTQQGFHRFLGRGYDIRPDTKAFGTYSARLETGGEYDAVEIAVSDKGETETPAQKQGTITLPRERDSYLFQASPGAKVNIVVNGIGSPALPDPLVELYDPEDFLIAACDNYEGRGRNAVISITLPAAGRTFPAPSTYRIAVTGVDTASSTTTGLSNSVCHVRKPNGGQYELKVFSGPLAGDVTKAPTVSSVFPDAAVQGSANVPVTINGTNFTPGTSVSFSGMGVTAANVEVVHAGRLSATVSVANDAQPGARDVTVTNNGGLSAKAEGAFRVMKTLGKMMLTWSAPPSGSSMAPPANLALAFMPENSTQQAAGQTAAGMRALHNRAATVRVTADHAQATEIEPNNSPSQAQRLTGDMLIDLLGQAETRDIGTIVFGGDDIEDLFKISIRSPGLSVVLSGFTSDCDLYVLDESGGSIIGSSANASANMDELIELDALPAGTYLIGVSIRDSAPLGPDSSVYFMLAGGDFGGTPVTTLQSYRVHRSLAANAKQTGKVIGTAGADITSFTDPVPHTGRFYYQVTAVYDQGESDPSNEVTRTVTEIRPDAENRTLPSAYALLQNFPNPFNPGTTIVYELPRPSYVRLGVYDVLGRELETLVDGMNAAGRHTVNWNAAKMPSGIYFYRLTAGEFSQTRKLTVVR